jgi:predicted enzyme related to lactoylglutathione lyase
MDQPIAYFEITGPDSEARASFYAKVLGWKRH